MKRRLRVRRQRDFQAVLQAGRVFAGKSLVAFARPRPAAGWRVGVAVSRQVRGSVRRNRARRRVREAARARLLSHDLEDVSVGIGYDVVLIARPAALELSQVVLEEDAEAVRLRLGRRR